MKIYYLFILIFRIFSLKKTEISQLSKWIFQIMDLLTRNFLFKYYYPHSRNDLFLFFMLYPLFLFDKRDENQCQKRKIITALFFYLWYLFEHHMLYDIFFVRKNIRTVHFKLRSSNNTIFYLFWWKKICFFVNISLKIICFSWKYFGENLSFDFFWDDSYFFVCCFEFFAVTKILWIWLT